jgi:peptidoglycan hydrolase-like protein with peptidoglycan-binding domain
MSVLSCEHAYNWSAVAKDYKLWIAKYKDHGIDYNYDMSDAGSSPQPKYWDTYVMWQWTSVGRLDGYGGNLDCDLFYGERAEWLKLCEKDSKPMSDYIEVSNGVEHYSKAKQGDLIFTIDGKPSNFKVKEFACNDGSDEILIDGNLVRYLQRERDLYGSTTITSGYRTPSYNAKIGGVPNSQHVYGKASDTICKNGSPLEVAMTAEAMGMGGIGLYSGFTHIDTRDGKSRWDQRSGRQVGVSTFFQTIKYGSTGEYVKIAQRKLGVSVDGIFGNNTKNAVIAFQDNKNLVADGIVGRLTWTELMK